MQDETEGMKNDKDAARASHQYVVGMTDSCGSHVCPFYRDSL